VLKCIFNSKKIGSFKFKYYYKDNLIIINNNKGPDNIIYIPGGCNKENSQIIPQESENIIGTENIIIIKCFDKYKNEIKKGGEKFTANIKVDAKDELDAKITDNKDGSYTLTYTKSLFGIYSIVILSDNKNFYETKLDLNNMNCQEEYKKCPNNDKICYTDIRDCIPSEIKCDNPEESEEKPFKCKNTNNCVKSLTECDPEEGYKKCKYMNASYPEGKDYLCPYYLPLDCKRKYPNYRILCADGICRTSKKLQPNQIVCPIGKVLCVDLTCKDSLSQCYTDYPDCNDQIRCPDQSCVDDQKNCPTTITCPVIIPDIIQKVCPDGKCVTNEIYCDSLKTCPEETPFLCLDKSCAKNAESCTHFVACGHGKSLCPDLICKDSC